MNFYENSKKPMLESLSEDAKIEIIKTKENVNAKCNGTRLSILAALASAEIDILKNMKIPEKFFESMKKSIKESREK
jgi:hypothetical protein